MPVLDNYSHFTGRHWETGTVCNYLAYQGITAPHTGQPYSEALLLGVSGGVVMGYFTFAYEGYDPHVALLTRNTFDPLKHHALSPRHCAGGTADDQAFKRHRQSHRYIGRWDARHCLGRYVEPAL